MKIAALLFDKLTVLDLIGPLEVLSWLPGAEVVWVGPRKGPVRAAPAGVSLNVEKSFEEVVSADVLVVPGGPGVRPLLKDEAALAWIRRMHERTEWTTSVCTGSLLLGAAGLLKDLDATTHWNAAQALSGFGARYVEKRVVPQGKIVTSAGVSSGIDMALWLVGRIAGDEQAKMIQLAIEYDPQPPYDSGAPSKASASVLEKSRAHVGAVVAAALAQP